MIKREEGYIMTRGDRPELQAPANVYYNASEAEKVHEWQSDILREEETLQDVLIFFVFTAIWY